MQGLFIDGIRRPASKKEVKEAVKANPDTVRLEATAIYNTEYDGPVSKAPVGEYHFVGPNPYRDRRFYGTIVVKPDGKVVVK